MEEGDKVGLDFQDGLKALLEGKKMRRAAWPEGSFVSKQEGADGPKMMRHDEGAEDGDFKPEQADWFAADWMTA